MYYPEFEYSLDWITNSHDWYAISEGKDKELFDSLFSIMNPIRPDKNGFRTIWIALERGPEPSDEECDEAVACDGYESREEYIRFWFEMHSQSMRYYEVDAGENSDGFRSLIVKNRFAFQYDPDGRIFGNTVHRVFEDELQPFLRALIDHVSESMKKVYAGTYNSWLSANLPPRNRLGRIRRSALWKAFPYSRERYIDDLTDEEIKAFADAVDSGQTDIDNIGRLDEMTAGLFFRACGIGYRAAGAHQYGVRLNADTDKGLYLINADGRDEGLRDIPEDDPEAFESWLRHRPHIGHPWEVCRGGNSTHVDLCPIEDDGGWYLSLAGELRAMEVVRFYLALSKEGFPVYVYRAEAIRKAVLGEDNIGIVPEGVIPAYCGSMFPGENIISFMNISEDAENNEAFMSEAVFDPPDKLELNE